MSCPSGEGVGRAIALVAGDALGAGEPVGAVAGALADGAVQAASARVSSAHHHKGTKIVANAIKASTAAVRTVGLTAAQAPTRARR